MAHHINRRQQFLELLILLLVPLLIWEGHIVWIVFTPNTNLLKAAETGNLRRARYALARGADANARGQHWRCGLCTPLEIAVDEARIPEVGKEHEGGEKKRRYIEMATLLLEHGADINAKDSFGITALMRAVANVDMLTLLLAHEPEIDARDNDGVTALGHAAHRTQTAMLLIQAGADITVIDSSGETLLMKAAEGGSLPLVRYLVDHGLDVNAEGHARYTALMRAINRGYVAVAKFLLDHGADPNTIDNLKSTALMKAAERGYSKCVALLLTYGADVNAGEDSWRSALRRAAMWGNTEAARILLEHGANVHGEAGRDVLEQHIQGIRCKPEFIELLREYGVEVTDEDRCDEP